MRGVELGVLEKEECKGKNSSSGVSGKACQNCAGNMRSRSSSRRNGSVEKRNKKKNGRRDAFPETKDRPERPPQSSSDMKRKRETMSFGFAYPLRHSKTVKQKSEKTRNEAW